MATFNVRGLQEVGKRQAVEEWMHRTGIDLLMLQETKVNRAQTENRRARAWYFTSGVGPGVAAGAAALRAGGWRVPPTVARKAVEHIGVEIVCRGRLRKYLEEVRPRGARMMEVTFATQPCLAAVCAAAPHAGRAGAEKESFYLKLAERARAHPGTKAVMIAGDFNAHVAYESGPPARHIGPGVRPRPRERGGADERPEGRGEAGDDRHSDEER